jgi:hypothetical protein
MVQQDHPLGFAGGTRGIKIEGLILFPQGDLRFLGIPLFGDLLIVVDPFPFMSSSPRKIRWRTLFFSRSIRMAKVFCLVWVIRSRAPVSSKMGAISEGLRRKSRITAMTPIFIRAK